MISEAAAKQQVARLAGLSFYPATRESLRELVCAMQVAESEAAAKDFTSNWLRSYSECPKPAEVRRTLYVEAEDAWEPPYRRQGRCRTCDGSRYVSKIVNGYACASPCPDCRPKAVPA